MYYTIHNLCSILLQDGWIKNGLSIPRNHNIFPMKIILTPSMGWEYYSWQVISKQTKTSYGISIVTSKMHAFFWFRFVHLIVAFYVEHNEGCYLWVCTVYFGWMSSIGTTKWHSKKHSSWQENYDRNNRWLDTESDKALKTIELRDDLPSNETNKKQKTATS